MKLGAHVSIAGGLEQAARRARALGCETMQIFSRSPRGGRARELGAGEIATLQELLAQAGVSPLVVHIPYFVNLATPDDGARGQAVKLVIEDMERARSVGAPFLVVHVGHSLGGPEEEAIKRVAGVIDGCLRAVADGPVLLLETVAGVKTEIGHRFESLAGIIETARERDRVAVCFDTCHVFAAGYDLSAREAVDATLARFDAVIGLERLKLVHLNDSLGACGSRIDRHAHIGRGFIGEAGFREIVNHPLLRGLAGIIETPVDTPEDDARNLAALRRLRGS